MRLDKSKLSGRPWMVAKGGSWFIWLTRTVMVIAGQSANSSHGYNWLHPSSLKFFLWREELPCRLMMVWWWCLTGSLSQDFKRTESWHFIFMARKNGRPIQVIRQQYHPFSWGRLPAACSDRNTETQCQCLQQKYIKYSTWTQLKDAESKRWLAGLTWNPRYKIWDAYGRLLFNSAPLDHVVTSIADASALAFLC